MVTVGAILRAEHVNILLRPSNRRTSEKSQNANFAFTEFSEVRAGLSLVASCPPGKGITYRNPAEEGGDRRMPAHKSIRGPLWLTLVAALVAAIVMLFFVFVQRGEATQVANE